VLSASSEAVRGLRPALSKYDGESRRRSAKGVVAMNNGAATLLPTRVPAMGGDGIRVGIAHTIRPFFGANAYALFFVLVVRCCLHELARGQTCADAGVADAPRWRGFDCVWSVRSPIIRV
jgi:hypothetical protein